MSVTDADDEGESGAARRGASAGRGRARGARVSRRARGARGVRGRGAAPRSLDCTDCGTHLARSYMPMHRRRYCRGAATDDDEEAEDVEEEDILEEEPIMRLKALVLRRSCKMWKMLSKP